MILVGLCTPLFWIVTSIIAILPNSAFEGQTVTGFIGMFSTAFQFFPADVWILALRVNYILDNNSRCLWFSKLYFKVNSYYQYWTIGDVERGYYE